MAIREVSNRAERDVRVTHSDIRFSGRRIGAV
jgi:hypothetical protein